MREPELDLRVAAPVGTVVQVGRVVLEPPAAPPVDPTVPGLAGREGELAAVLRAVAAGAPGVVLAGGPGLGTTALALAAAARLAGRYPGGVRFVPLTSPDPGPALRELLRDLGVRAGEIPAATPHRTALLRAVLAGTPTLLVLDDARSAAQVRALLPGGGSAVLVTTAAPLGELHLDGLAPVAVRGLPSAAAAALLPSCHAGLDVPALCPAPAVESADALLEACHGSPLAVRLLAGTFPSPAAGLRALRTQQSTGRPRDAAAAARAAARIALAALPAAEREVLEAVRATRLPLVDPARCAAVLPDRVAVGPLLRVLLRRGLLSPRPGPGDGPWCALPTVVAEVLPAEPEWAALPGPLPERTIPLDGPTPLDGPAPAGPKAAPAGPEAAPAGPLPLDNPAPLVGPATPAPDTGTLLQRLAHHAAAHADPAVGADALVHLAAARTRRGDDTAALAAATAALDLADRTGDPVLLGRAAHRLAAALAAASEPDPAAPPAPPPLPSSGSAPAFGTAPAYPAGLRDARAAFDLAVDLLAGRDDAAHAQALVDRAHLARRRDRPAEALADLHAALALFRTLGRPADVAAAWQEVAAVERAAGHPCRAVAAHRSALAALAEAGDPAATGWTRLAAGLVQVGELPAACPDLLAARLADSAAARSVRELRELDPAAPDWALVAALTGGHTRGE
ncbi:hypothetical protein GCM10010472_04790 [Pseudonocardia halophobica]|uniref:hypothetical protein n=1 Tax=Pseudonocardia halophobica TaxID=29401 RepID=UPI0005605733